MTEREAAIKRLVDAGGRWPPKFLPGPPWRGSGRYQRVRCVECGYESRPMTAICSLCGERLHAGS